MRWLPSFLASLRAGRPRVGPEPKRRATPQRPPRRDLRRRPLAIEPFEERLCLSIDLLVCSYYTNSVIRYDGTTGAFRGAFVPQGYGGLEGPHGLALGLGGHVLVASGPTSSVLRYHRTTGAFLGAFIPLGSGGLDGAAALVMGPKNNQPQLSNPNPYSGNGQGDGVPADANTVLTPSFSVVTANRTGGGAASTGGSDGEGQGGGLYLVSGGCAYAFYALRAENFASTSDPDVFGALYMYP